MPEQNPFTQKFILMTSLKRVEEVEAALQINKVKMITAPAAANKHPIITTPANRLRKALRRFGLFVRLKDLFLNLSHVTQIFFLLVVMFLFN